MTPNITPEALARAVERALGWREGKRDAELDELLAFAMAFLDPPPELLAAQPDKLHQHLLDMLGAKDHVDAGRIIGELHAKLAQPASSAGGQESVATVGYKDGYLRGILTTAGRKLHVGTKLYAIHPQPAAPQGVDLGKLRAHCVSRIDEADRERSEAGHGGDERGQALAGTKRKAFQEVLALIDGQHQQQENPHV